MSLEILLVAGVDWAFWLFNGAIFHFLWLKFQPLDMGSLYFYFIFFLFLGSSYGMFVFNVWDVLARVGGWGVIW